MTDIDTATQRFVVSRDGTRIAYWVSGEGRPLLLVHGVTADHTRWRPLLPYLEPHAKICTMDRRGRGASADGADYRLAREFEDVAAVVDVIADETGQAVDVYGHSFGGLCVFGAASRTSNVRRLVLYEGWPAQHPDVHALPPEVDERMEALISGGDREAALETLFLDGLGFPEDELAALRAQPAWQARVAAVHTTSREIRGIGEAPFDPEQASRITAPTLLLTGSDSTDPATADTDAVAAALPDARIAVLGGQQHLADVLAPDVFADPVVAFLREGAP